MASNEMFDIDCFSIANSKEASQVDVTCPRLEIYLTCSNKDEQDPMLDVPVPTHSLSNVSAVTVRISMKHIAHIQWIHLVIIADFAGVDLPHVFFFLIDAKQRNEQCVQIFSRKC